MFSDAVGDTLANLAQGFSQGWNQSLGYQSYRGYYQDPYTGRYYPLPASGVPVTQYPVYPAYAQPFGGGGDMLPLLLVGGVLLFALMKD